MHTQPSLNTKFEQTADVIRESSFRAELTQAVTDNDKAFYNLLMSMVSTDATDLDQFHQYKTTPVETLNDLNKKFNVAHFESVGQFDVETELKCNGFANSGNISSINLAQSLARQPLVAKSDNNLPDEVIANLDYNIKLKYLAQQKLNRDIETNSIIDETKVTPKLDVETWFNTLNQARAMENIRFNNSNRLSLSA
ncbi:hypothetical protein KO525_06275 [Psychrosphaera sp. B3R10]|uniref:VC2046/SO_2500 family protein n=1 Tax=unclassified Psychrosphaera TaxID=2641570 RepID=UPI001C0839A6|nr:MULTISPECIES: VC2046/SO_2500 family protein [unclassified Psychrosphaera]MBU2882301.1 hypothetical protein [Psychrosphaera sp. I2R16]MBU2988982.1 hypothetical protein [Psychrosphaera sp. B3R10]